MNWQPIETAPQDGTDVLLYWPTLYNEGHFAVGNWNADRYSNKPQPFWDGARGASRKELRDHLPTHWVKLEGPIDA